jgi:hypothetical protein
MPCNNVAQENIYQYNMAGQLNFPPYQAVYWSVYNIPDSTGQYSGYFGKLENIQVVSVTNVETGTSYNVPTGPASGDLCGNYPDPIVVGLDGYSLPALSDGYLNWNGTAWALSTISVGGGLPGAQGTLSIVPLSGAVYV